MKHKCHQSYKIMLNIVNGIKIKYFFFINYYIKKKLNKFIKILEIYIKKFRK